jgi:hypothetical protein
VISHQYLPPKIVLVPPWFGGHAILQIKHLLPCIIYREERRMTAPYPLHHTNRSIRALLRPADLEVLRILWTHGPQTIRAIYDEIAAQRTADYLAVARTVTYLARLGLLDRSAEEQWLGGNYRYVATISEREYTNACIHLT